LKRARELFPGLFRVRLPLPFPLQSVNAYVVRGDDGFTVIDAGLRSPETEVAWSEAMRELGMTDADVVRIVLTHHHPDHLGMAGVLQERSRAPVYLSAEGAAQARLLWGPGSPMTEALLELFARHGMDAGTLADMRVHLDGFAAQVSPLPEFTELRSGEFVPIGDGGFRAIATPGHAAGHFAFYEAFEAAPTDSADGGTAGTGGVLFCGDHVLEKITPNVGFLPGFDDDPLGSFLKSLEALGTLSVRIAYPGHGEPFSSFGARTSAIIEHHRRRLAAIEAMLAEPMSAYAVCRRLFGDRLTIHQLRFAMAETLAHLVYLERRGRLVAQERGGVVAFEAAVSRSRVS